MKITLPLKTLIEFAETRQGKMALFRAHNLKSVDDSDAMPFDGIPFKGFELKRLLTEYLTINADELGCRTSCFTDMKFNAGTKIITLS